MICARFVCFSSTSGTPVFGLGFLTVFLSQFGPFWNFFPFGRSSSPSRFLFPPSVTFGATRSNDFFGPSSGLPFLPFIPFLVFALIVFLLITFFPVFSGNPPL